MRVNARLEGEYERQMEFLTQTTGLGVSDVIKASISHYYRALHGGGKPRLANVRAQFGAHDSGRTDVSVRSKEAFGEGVAEKHSKTPSR